MISKQTLYHYWPKEEEIPISNIPIGGIASSIETSAYVNLTLDLQTTAGHSITIPAEVHVVETLSCDLLIGLNVLKKEGVTIDLKNDLLRIHGQRGMYESGATEEKK
jgi:hypothetical protein